MADGTSSYDQWVDAGAGGLLPPGSSGSLGLSTMVAQPSTASSAGVLRTLESSLLPQTPQTSSLTSQTSFAGGAGQRLGQAPTLGQTPTVVLPDMGSPPSGWPGFVGSHFSEGDSRDKLMGTLPTRGGLFDNERFIGQLVDTESTRAPTLAGMNSLASGPWRGFSYPGAPTDTGGSGLVPGMQRPETPILAYVDRASMPGFVDFDDKECRVQQFDRDREVQHLSSWSVPRDVQPKDSAEQWDQWEAELAEWKEKYGCPEAKATTSSAEEKSREPTEIIRSQVPQEPPSIDIVPALREETSTGNGAKDRSISKNTDIGEYSGMVSRASVLDTDIGSAEMHRPSVVQNMRPSVLPARPDAPMTLGQIRGSVVDTDISMREIVRSSMSNNDIDGSERATSSQRPSVLPPRPDCGTMQRQESGDDESHLPQSSVPQQVDQNLDSTAGVLNTVLGEGPGAALRRDIEALDAARMATQEAVDAELAKAEERSREIRRDLMQLQDKGNAATNAENVQPLTPKPPAIAAPPSASRAPQTAGRQYEHSSQELELATQMARARVKADGSWKSQYSDAQLQKRDFFLDIRKQRDRDKGRQATGPIWLHLATQAKNIANTLDLLELLETLKLFASVRFDDYELYMRLLGEVPHYVTQATAAQLCELIRILSRRRLRERNYVDMVAAQLLQRIRTTDDTLPVRLLVKTANAFASLECRSNPKFVEHFLRHMEHRMQEFDASMCCLVSSVFVDQYMNDALRRAYLIRCSETQAGFQCPLEEARNIACTELVLRKEHHSLVTALPPFVVRYLDKVRRHAEFDKWGAVTLPATVAPDGPKGKERAKMNMSLQLKASTATKGSSQQADVYSSDMHRDVSACLTHLGVDHENGVLAGPYLLDVVALDMVTPSKRIVYEINSPHNYYEGTQQLIAEKRLRHRMIARLGHKLHMVNAEDWTKLSAAQKMTFMLKLQQAQQDLNAKEERQKAAANTMRTPLPALPIGQPVPTDPMKLKSISDLRAPIRVPVPPSQRARQPLTAR